MWLAAKFLGLQRWVWVLAAVAALVALMVWLRYAEEKDDRRNQEIGRSVEREASTREVLKRTEEGNATREIIRRDADARYAECLRSARTPSNCVGLLPEREGD